MLHNYKHNGYKIISLFHMNSSSPWVFISNIYIYGYRHYMQVSTCKFQFHYIHNNKVPNITVKLPNRSSPKKTQILTTLLKMFQLEKPLLNMKINSIFMFFLLKTTLCFSILHRVVFSRKIFIFDIGFSSQNVIKKAIKN